MTDKEKAVKFLYEMFAADTSEVARHLGLSVEKTLELLNSTPAVVTGDYVNDLGGQGKDEHGRYMELTWQCYATYDHHTWEECRAEAVEAGAFV